MSRSNIASDDTSVSTTSDVPPRALPLQGIVVVDLGQIYLGPYATFLMAKAGATVIKVEPPAGEPARRRSTVGRGASLPFCMLNANKRCVTINLKTERGRDLLLGLVRRADVLIENFAPGVLDKLGVGWSVLRTTNPRLIYASGTGFGLSGPDREQLAMDLTIQAASGAMSVTGFADSGPLKSGVAFADIISGVHLYGAVVTALFDRERSGQGRLVEVAMLEAVFPTLASNLGMLYSSNGKGAARTGNRHGGLSVAPYNVYSCADGHVALICQLESHWRGLTDAMGRPDLVNDSRFSDNARRVAHMDETDAVVAAWTATKSRKQLAELSIEHKFICSPVRELPEVVNDRHMHERGMLEWIDHPELGRVVLPGSPLRFHGSMRESAVPSESLGASNTAIFSEMLGVRGEELSRLAAEGVI
jgi:crotonobetainyl-CoA:carnitine CoA-transferase CaiB-like acyl-CoA transferase